MPTTTSTPRDEAALAFALERVLRNCAGQPEELRAAVDNLVRLRGPDAYQELLRHLASMELEAEQARAHVEAILAHRDWMEGRLGGAVDLRVALLSHFLGADESWRDPLVVDRDVYERTWDSAYRDALTGLHNYRYLVEYLERETVRSERHGWPLSLLMIDVDDFKVYNDRHGHEAGNDVLATLGRVLDAILRRSDVAARYGGEEFALILPNTPKTGAHVVAERARQGVAEAFLERVTISIGIATFPADAADPDGLVRHADRALYGAKGGGKNRIELFGNSTRSYRRVAATGSGSLRALAETQREIRLLGVSEGGASFLAPEALEPDTLVELSLALRDGAEPIRATVRVVRVLPTEDGQYRVTGRITDMPAPDRNLLSRFVRSRGQR